MVAAIYILGVIVALAAFLAANFLAGFGLVASLLTAFGLGTVVVSLLVAFVLVLTARKDKAEAAEAEIPSLR